MSNMLSTTILVEDRDDCLDERGVIAGLRFYVVAGGSCVIRGSLAGRPDVHGNRPMSLSADDARELGRWLRANFGA